MIMFLDLETRSKVDLKKSGAYVYSEDDSTEFLCISVAFNDEPVNTIVNPRFSVGNLAVQALLVPRITTHISEGHLVVAHNANFERLIWNNVCTNFPPLTTEQLRCTRSMVAAMGLPLSLKDAGKTLGLEMQKQASGTRLINLLSKPDKFGNFNERLDLVEQMVEYCEQDVETTRELFNKCFLLSDTEQEVYQLDQTINDRGFKIDSELIEAMKDRSAAESERLNQRISKLTRGEVDKVTKVKALASYLQLPSVSKETLEAEFRRAPEGSIRKEVIKCRLDAGKSSVKKLDSFLNHKGSEDRVRGTLVYHGAATGRWSGRGPQIQNLPRGTVKKAEDYIPSVLYGNMPEEIPALSLISSLIRSTIIAKEDHFLVGCDFSQIEARILAYLAGQNDVLQAFSRKEDVYKLEASKLFRIPVEKVTPEQRFLGKVTVLACGYQVGPTTFREQMKAMYGKEIEELEAEKLVYGYRDNNEKVVDFWNLLNLAAIEAVKYSPTPVSPNDIKARTFSNLVFQKEDQHLRIKLPSGRKLTYCFAELSEELSPWGKPTWGVSYIGRPRQGFKHGKIRMYGGRWTENIVQAIARDVMVEAMFSLEIKGYRPIMTVHDEIVCEVPDYYTSTALETVEEIMTTSPSWAQNLPIGAEAWVGQRYRK